MQHEPPSFLSKPLQMDFSHSKFMWSMEWYSGTRTNISPQTTHTMQMFHLLWFFFCCDDLNDRSSFGCHLAHRIYFQFDCWMNACEKTRWNQALIFSFLNHFQQYLQPFQYMYLKRFPSAMQAEYHCLDKTNCFWRILEKNGYNFKI